MKISQSLSQNSCLVFFFGIEITQKNECGLIEALYLCVRQFGIILLENMYFKTLDDNTFSMRSKHLSNSQENFDGNIFLKFLPTLGESRVAITQAIEKRLKNN